MAIAKTLCSKAARLGDSIFERPSEALMNQAVTVNSSSHEEDLNRVGCITTSDHFH